MLKRKNLYGKKNCTGTINKRHMPLLVLMSVRFTLLIRQGSFFIVKMLKISIIVCFFPPVSILFVISVLFVVIVILILRIIIQIDSIFLIIFNIFIIFIWSIVFIIVIIIIVYCYISVIILLLLFIMFVERHDSGERQLIIIRAALHTSTCLI